MKKEIFLKEIQKLNWNQIDLQLIENAFEIAEKSHYSYRRIEGVPYVEHAISVANKLLSWNSPSHLIAAGLLHDVMNSNYSSPPSYEEIKENCGEDVEILVRASTEFSQFGSNYPRDEIYQGLDSIDTVSELFPEIANSLSRTPLVFIIRIANHLENAKSIHLVEPENQDYFARVALNILAPFSARLGMYSAKRELEDVGFKTLEPQIYYPIYEKYNLENIKETENLIISSIQEHLNESNLNANLMFEKRSIYAIYRNWLETGGDQDVTLPLESAYPYLVIVNSQAECYQALGLLHSLYSPINSKFVDYIANPKMNGYSSLHTRLRIRPGSEVEVIIRDQTMHNEAENGITVKWAEQPQVFEFSSNEATTQNKSRISVLTPVGEIKILPKGATAVDFAFSIHKEVGFQCVGAIVDGKPFSLTEPLKSLTTVKIITNKNSVGPRTDWLNSVKTKVAVSEIQKYYQIKKSNELIDRGCELFNDVLDSSDINYSFSELVERVKRASVELKLSLADLLISIGSGDKDANQVFQLVTYDDLAKLSHEKLRNVYTIITIIGSDRIGLLATIGLAASNLNISIETIEAHKIDGNLSRTKISIGDYPRNVIDQLVKNLKSLDGIRDVFPSGKQAIPVTDSSSYTTDPARGYQFKGRHKEIFELVEYLDNPGQSVLIWGPRRIGKTSLLVEFPERLRLRRERYIPVSIDLQKLVGSSTFELVSAINKSIALTIDKATPPKWSVIKKNPLYTMDDFIKRSLPQFARLILIIDEFQLFNDLKEMKDHAFLSKKELLLYLRNQVQHEKRIDMIFSGGGVLSRLVDNEDVSALLEVSKFVELGFLAREDATRIITETNVNYDTKAVEKILELTSNIEGTGNHPGYIQIICSELSLKYGKRISVRSLEEWLEKYFPDLPVAYFNNLWGFSLGLDEVSRIRCRATLVTMATLQKEKSWINNSDLLNSELKNILSAKEISKSITQLEAIRSIQANITSPDTYRIKLQIAANWLTKNYTLKEITEDNSSILK